MLVLEYNSEFFMPKMNSTNRCNLKIKLHKLERHTRLDVVIEALVEHNALKVIQPLLWCLRPLSNSSLMFNDSRPISRTGEETFGTINKLQTISEK